MKLSDILLMGVRNLWRRKLRTFLTILGVIIGTASIVVMVSLGIGMDESFKQQLERMGDLNIITVDSHYIVEAPNGIIQEQQKVLDDKAVANISNIPGVEAVMPMMESWLKLVSNKYVAHVGIVGTDIESLHKFDYKTSQGRLPTESDINAVVVGSDIPRQFYNPKARGRYRYSYSDEPLVDVMNDRLELTFDMSYGERRYGGFGGSSYENQRPPKLYKINCVGILEESFGDDRNYKVYMDINMYRKLIKDNNRNQRSSSSRAFYRGTSSSQQEGYDQVKVKVSDINKVEEVQEKINELGFGAYSLANIRNSMKEQSKTIQMILGGIGAVSLFVASLGITNTMIMSIYERTREIGIMKVLGCRLKDIRKTFLVEAAVIGLLGGVLGIGLSYGVSFALNYFSGGMSGGMFFPVYGQTRISVIPPWLALASISFATCIGLISGLYPAHRAMRLSALAAIRTE